MSVKKVWFITGASRGFGALMAREAINMGDFVVATARKSSDIENTLGKHPRLLSLNLDVTIESDAKKATERAIEQFGRIDVLVNNAGYGLLGAVEESSASETEKLFQTNVFGLLHVTRAVLPQMRKQRSGHIINFSSLGGYQAYPGWGVYGATKFAIEGLTEALSAELAPLGIHATVVEPGFFRTDFLNQNSLLSTELSIDDYAETVGAMRVFAKGANHQQPGNPERLARAIMVLGRAKNPPLRLPLGTDALARIHDKNRSVAIEAEKWQEIAASTDFTADSVDLTRYIENM